jgi:hypothetical protein
MTTGATAALGTLFKIGDGATPETFTTVAEVTDLTPPKISSKKEDATSQDSTWEESIPVMLSGGQISLTVNWIPSGATHNETTGLLSWLLNKTKRNCKVVLPSTEKTFAFLAWVSSFEGGTPVSGKKSAKFTLEISGPVGVT